MQQNEKEIRNSLLNQSNNKQKELEDAKKNQALKYLEVILINYDTFHNCIENLDMPGALELEVLNSSYFVKRKEIVLKINELEENFNVSYLINNENILHKIYLGMKLIIGSYELIQKKYKSLPISCLFKDVFHSSKTEKQLETMFCNRKEKSIENSSNKRQKIK